VAKIEFFGRILKFLIQFFDFLKRCCFISFIMVSFLYNYNPQNIPFGYVHTTLNVPYLIPNCEVNKCLAFLVLAWGTSWEPDGDVTFSFFVRALKFDFNER
jgi:hypothetical protein